MIRRTLATVATMLCLAGCAHGPPKALHQGDSTFQRNLETYAVRYHPVGSDHNTKLIFDTAVHDAMKAKGYRLAAGGEPDMVLNFTALTKTESGGGEDTSGTAALAGASSSESVDKVVMVTIERASTDEIMWVGWSTGYYAEEQILPKTREAVAGILALIPSRDPGAAPPAPAAPAAPTAPPGS